MGIKKVFPVMLICMMFAFAKAQNIKSSQEYFQFINAKLEQIQAKEWEYYSAAVHESEKKSQKYRARLVKELETSIQEVFKTDSNDYNTFQEVVTTYLVDLRSYHVEDYDLAMTYEIPHYVSSEEITAYIENAVVADNALKKNRISLHTAITRFKAEHNIKKSSFLENKLQRKLESAQEIFTQSHVVYAAFNEIRADQVKFIEALKRKDMNAAMQLLDALTTNASTEKTTAITKVLLNNNQQFKEELVNGLRIFEELALKIAPKALSSEMTKADASMIPEIDTNNISTTKALNKTSNTTVSTYFNDYNLKIKAQSKRINDTQLQYLSSLVPKK
jgi:hypothetical protein